MIHILFVGAGNYPIYERAFYEAAKKIEGVQASLFISKPYFTRIRNSYIRRFEDKYSVGFIINKINQDLLETCRKEKTDIVFLYSCRHITPGTVKKLKESGFYIACYNNDDPYSDFHKHYFWRHWRAAVRYCDITYVYRKSNIEKSRQDGARESKVLRSYYIEMCNYFIPEGECLRKAPDVLFLGHREHDEREEFILELAKNKISVGIPNIKEWADFGIGNEFIVKLDHAREDYNILLNQTKIGLVFLSKINHDTYTRRCFEIPAAGTMMLSVYTEDLSSLFKEDEEIVFFRSKNDFVKKAKYYLSHDAERKKIAMGGYTRIKKDGHEAGDRVMELIQDYKKLKGTENTEK